MFKYPAPWQVLCSNLEKREQVSVVDGSRRSIITKDDLITNNKDEYFVRPTVEETVKNHISDGFENHSNTAEENILNSQKITVFQTYTTKESDLLTTDIHVNEEQAYITKTQRLNTAETTLSTPDPDSDMDRVTRSLIFSLSSSKSVDGSREDLINSIPEESQEAERRSEVWLTSPDRNAKLKVLRGEERFEIRTHRPETSPSKLFTDNDDEYDVKKKPKSHEITPEKVLELEKERRDIIKRQSLRKSLDAEDLLEIQDKDEPPKWNKEVNGTSASQHTENVDTEQINFEAARKQFVMMEKKQNSLPITPHTQTRHPRFSSRLLSNNDEYSYFSKLKDPFILEQDVKASRNNSSVTLKDPFILEQDAKASRNNSAVTLKDPFILEQDVKASRNNSAVTLKDPFILEQEVKASRSNSAVTQEVNGKDETSSAHSKSFEGLYLDTGDQEKSRVVNIEAVPQVISYEKESVPNPSDETPIEREIRLALQREASLRKERGIQHSEVSNEVIEIHTFPVLAKSSETEKPKKTKDRTRTSLFVQREIEKEAQREADLKNEGKVVGLYDKGNTQELEERKKLFEQPDIVSAEPQKTIISASWKGLADTQDSMHQVDSGYTNKMTDWTIVDAPLPYSVRTNWKPAPLNVYRTRRLSADNILDVITPKETSEVQEKSQEPLILHQENVQNDAQKSSPHLQVNNAEEKINQKRTLQVSKSADVYGAELRRSRSNVIEEEIRQTLERDRELKEQRRKSGFYSVTDSDDDQQSSSYNQYRRSPLPTENVSSWSATPWKSTPATALPSVQMFTPKRYPRFVDSEMDSGLKRQDNWYAGIDPSDAVNTEIVESTRVNRHKSPMALRWEAGLYANEPSE